MAVLQIRIELEIDPARVDPQEMADEILTEYNDSRYSTATGSPEGKLLEAEWAVG